MTVHFLHVSLIKIINQMILRNVMKIFVKNDWISKIKTVLLSVVFYHAYGVFLHKSMDIKQFNHRHSKILPCLFVIFQIENIS